MKRLSKKLISTYMVKDFTQMQIHMIISTKTTMESLQHMPSIQEVKMPILATNTSLQWLTKRSMSMTTFHLLVTQATKTKSLSLGSTQSF